MITVTNTYMRLALKKVTLLVFSMDTFLHEFLIPSSLAKISFAILSLVSLKYLDCLE